MREFNITARHALGVLLLGVVVMLWVASSFLMRSIFGEGKSYDKPFLVTWINTGTFSLYLIPWFLRSVFSKTNGRGRGRLGPKTPEQDHQSKVGDDRRSAIPGDNNDIELMDPSTRMPLLAEDRQSRSVREEHIQGLMPNLPSTNSVRTFGSHDAFLPGDDLQPLTTLETAKLGCIFSVVWFAANYFGNVSLSYTNVASFTIISSLSGFFTLAFGSMLGVETFTMAKVIALIISICGVALVTTQDTTSSGTRESLTDLIIGDILALVGAALYGCYTVFLKFKVRNEERVSMTLFFGFVGIFNLCVLWPAIFLLDFTGLEPFELPSSASIWYIVAANAAITFVSDYLWVLAMLMTSPLVVTVGISMSIPLALLGDLLLYSHTASLLFFFGAALVFASFIAINVSYDSELKETQISQTSIDDENIEDERDED